MSQEENEGDILHIGNLLSIQSERHGTVVGRIIYRDVDLVRIMPQEVSDRAIDFPMTEDGSNFAPDLGVSEIEIIEQQTSDHYVDFLGARPGETLEFFTIDGQEAAPSGIVAEVVKSTSKDAIRLTDGRTLKFRGVGPQLPIAVVRVVTDEGKAATEADADAGADPEPVRNRKRDVLALLRSVLPSATVEMVPTAERSYPDSMQREDLFQELLADIPQKQRTNPRRIRFIEREVDLAVALKNKSLLRDDAGRVTGTAPYLITTIADAVDQTQAALPSAIPIVKAARLLNLDIANDGLRYKESDVIPRSIYTVEMESEELAARYLDGANPDTAGNGFFTYTYDLLSRGQGVLQGGVPREWQEDQDVVRTAGLGTAVQGLSAGLPLVKKDKDRKEENPPVSLTYLVSDVTDRGVRVLTADKYTNLKSGAASIVAPSDPSVVDAYVVLPPKAAMSLRPPKRPGHLPTALLYSAALEADNLPTIAQTLRDLYTPDAGSPQNAWTLRADAASATDVAAWLTSVLRYVVHPIDSLGPRTPRLLSLLDTLGIGVKDLAPAVADVIWSWTNEAQLVWRSLLADRRKLIQTALDAEGVRTFQSVTDTVGGGAAPLWAALRASEPLKELLEDIGRRNPSIADAPTLMTSALLTEAQGDAAPIVWSEIMKLDARIPEGADSTLAVESLAASRAYILKRKALRDRALLSLSAAPEVSTCPHAVRLEAVRNVRDVLQRSRLLRDFIEEFQGPRAGDWITCVLCKAECVCFHELMELEALAQPARMDAIQKQILVKYGGNRYEGKIVCRNCGQALQDIEYDEHVEFDDNGRPVTTGSVLTAEQMEEPTESTWKKAIADLAPPPVVFTSQSQREIGEALQTIAERGGLQIHSDVIRQIVRYADLYVSLRAPPADAYEKQRARMLTAASTKIKTATGVAGASVDVPVYAAVIDQLRVSALIALTAISIQSAEPTIVVNNPFPLCKFSRGGFPFNPTANPEEEGALLYVACIVGSIQRDATPWRSLTWSGETKLETRRKKALQVGLVAARIILGADPKSAPLSFTPEIRMALNKAQTDVAAIKEKALVSHTDELPVGFRPDPFPPKMNRPAIERDPVASLTSLPSDKGASITAALRHQGIAIVGELHAAAAGQVPTPTTTDAVCCPVALSAISNPQGETQLLKARTLLRRADPTTVGGGTHLWPQFEVPVPIPVEQSVDESVFFKLFLKYCYRGGQVGIAHEFSVGNACRQCGLRLGKPVDLIDFGKEGAAILAAQQGDLRIEITPAAFGALSEAVRRRKIMEGVPSPGATPWMTGLHAVAEAARSHHGEAIADLLESILAAVPPAKEMDEVERATLWAPLVEYMDQLRQEVSGRIGPLVSPTDKARAREATTAMAMFDSMTEDPFIEGPRALQEYWCAKVVAAGANFSITKITGALWSRLMSSQHTDLIDKLMKDNSTWFGGVMRDDVRPVLRSLGKALGPPLQAWIQSVRPATSSAWTTVEAQAVLRCIVLQQWRDALTTTSWLYADIVSTVKAEMAAAIADWTRALMFHVKQQFVRFSKETIKRILQDRAGLERDTIVEEFESIKDDDLRAAELLKKQFRIGRWAGGANLQKYDADTFEFENEQRKRMGIVDPPVNQIVLEGAQANDYGFGALAAEPEDGYDVGQGAEGDDY